MAQVTDSLDEYQAWWNVVSEHFSPENGYVCTRCKAHTMTVSIYGARICAWCFPKTNEILELGPKPVPKKLHERIYPKRRAGNVLRFRISLARSPEIWENLYDHISLINI